MQQGADGGVAATLRTRAVERPERVALRTAGQSWTYGALDAAVDAGVGALQADGVAPGDRVAVMLGNRPSFVVAVYAALRAGAVAVPINTGLTPSEVAHQLVDCEASAMVIGRAYTGVLSELRGTLPALRQVYVADTNQTVAADTGMRSWADAVVAAADRPPEPREVPGASLALLAYTSGTTGSPKAAMLSHANLLANHAQLVAGGAALAPDDVVLTALPLFHSYALNVALAMTLAAGATLELEERFDPSGSLSRIAEQRITVVVGAPPMYVAWLNTPGADEVDLSSVRLATSGAAPLDRRILARCADELSLDVREGYGLAEAGPVVASSVSLPSAVPGSVGAPLPGVEVRVMDARGEAQEGDPGILFVRGPAVFGGYWRAPEETAMVLDEHGWLDTGDIGYMVEGRLHLVDRAKDVVIVSGFNVYPAEVERALMAHPSIEQAAVVGTPHPYTGEAVKAFVVLAPGSSVTADELIAHTATMLARFKQPEVVEFVDALPTLQTGKVRRRLLRES